MLYARSEAPVGGHTEYADMRAACDALPAGKKARLQGLIAEHSLIYSRRKLGFTEFSPQEEIAFAPVRRPLLRRIPETGRESLYIASHIGKIGGMTDAEAEALLAELIAHAQFFIAQRALDRHLQRPEIRGELEVPLRGKVLRRKYEHRVGRECITHRLQRFRGQRLRKVDVADFGGEALRDRENRERHAQGYIQGRFLRSAAWKAAIFGSMASVRPISSRPSSSIFLLRGATSNFTVPLIV